MTTPHKPADPLGRTYTPDAVALSIVQRLASLYSPRTLVEPCVGGGAFVRAARRCWPGVQVHGYDLDPDAPGLGLCDDYAAPFDARDLHGRWSMAITNPPYGKAVGRKTTRGIIDAARRSADVCAMLVPIDYLTQVGYEDIVRQCAAVWPVLPRPFAHERGQMVLLWAHGQNAPTNCTPLRWR